MKKEAQQKAIAEACGWTNLYWLSGELRGGPGGLNAAAVPDYLNDLNAMADAVSGKFTDRYSRLLYDDYLLSVCTSARDRGRKEPTDDEWSAAIHATAAQRAEALLRTLGLWEES